MVERLKPPRDSPLSFYRHPERMKRGLPILDEILATTLDASGGEYSLRSLFRCVENLLNLIYDLPPSAGRDAQFYALDHAVVLGTKEAYDGRLLLIKSPVGSLHESGSAFKRDGPTDKQFLVIEAALERERKARLDLADDFGHHAGVGSSAWMSSSFTPLPHPDERNRKQPRPVDQSHPQDGKRTQLSRPPPPSLGLALKSVGFYEIAAPPSLVDAKAASFGCFNGAKIVSLKDGTAISLKDGCLSHLHPKGGDRWCSNFKNQCKPGFHGAAPPKWTSSNIMVHEGVDISGVTFKRVLGGGDPQRSARPQPAGPSRSTSSNGTGGNRGRSNGRASARGNSRGGRNSQRGGQRSGFRRQP